MQRCLVGSDPLFQNLLSATVPTFMTNPIFEDCGTDRSRRPGGFGCPTEPDVVASGVAGAFEYSVLEGGTIEGVVEWLDANGYAQDDDAPAELQGYLDNGFLFVAFRLRGGRGSTRSTRWSSATRAMNRCALGPADVRAHREGQLASPLALRPSLEARFGSIGTT